MEYWQREARMERELRNRLNEEGHICEECHELFLPEEMHECSISGYVCSECCKKCGYKEDGECTYGEKEW